MGKYGYRILSDKDGFYFALLANNTSRQEMIRSLSFPSIVKCRNNLSKFREFIIENAIKDDNSKYVQICRQSDDKYYLSYQADNKTRWYRPLGYGTKEYAKKAIRSIYKHIEEYTDYEKDGGD